MLSTRFLVHVMCRVSILLLTAAAPSGAERLWAPVPKGELLNWSVDEEDGVCVAEIRDGSRQIMHYPLAGEERIIFRDTAPVLDGSGLRNFVLSCNSADLLLLSVTGERISLIHQPFNGTARVLMRNNARIVRTAGFTSPPASEFLKRFLTVGFFGGRPTIAITVGPNENNENGIYIVVLELDLRSPNAPLKTLVQGAAQAVLSLNGPSPWVLMQSCNTPLSTWARMSRPYQEFTTPTTATVRQQNGLMQVTNPAVAPPLQYDGQLFGMAVWCAADRAFVSYVSEGKYKLDIRPDRGATKTLDLTQLGINNPDSKETQIIATGNGRILALHRGQMLELEEGKPPTDLVGEGTKFESIYPSRTRLFAQQPGTLKRLFVEMNPKLLTPAISGSPGERVLIRCTDCPASAGLPVVRRDGVRVDSRLEQQKGLETSVSIELPADIVTKKSTWYVGFGPVEVIKLPLQVEAVVRVLPATITKFVPLGVVETAPKFAPGTLAAIDGERLTGLMNADDGLTDLNRSITRPWNSQLALCRVLVDSKPIPISEAATLRSTSQSRIKVQLPAGLTPGPHDLVVERLLPGNAGVEIRSNVIRFEVVDTAPALFVDAGLVRAEGGTANLASPLRAGDRVTVSGTGFGSLSPEVREGLAAADVTAEPVRTLLPVSVWIKATVDGEDRYFEAVEVAAEASRTEPGVMLLSLTVPELPSGLTIVDGKPNAALVVKAGEVFAPPMPVFAQ